VQSKQVIMDAISQGKYSHAIELTNESINTCKDNSTLCEYLYLLAVSHRLNKNAHEAIVTAHKLLKLAPNHGRIHQELGHLQLAENDLAKAATAYYQATKCNPALIASWRALVDLYAKKKDATQAKELAQAQVSYLSQLPREILGGRDLMYEGQLHKADQVCRHFLQRNKHHCEAMLLLAEIDIQQQIYGEAEFLLESCIEMYPTHQAVAFEYLKLLAKTGKFDKANNCADKLLAQHPQQPQFITAKAGALVGLGELDEAITLYQALLQKDPEHSGLQLLIGHAFKAAGKLSDAVNAYQLAYKYKADFGDAYWSLANTKTYKFGSKQILQMQEYATQDEVSIEDKIHLEFSLGKAFEDSKDFDLSFAHYAKGNKLKQSQLNYQPEFIERQVAAQIEHCGAALFSKYKDVGSKQADPIFIVGLPRSGSTLLEQILASHSQVDGTMELHNILGLVSKLRGQNNQYPAILSELDQSYFKRFGEQYIDETKVYRAGSPLFIDKMPNNFLHLGLIKLILPKAKIIDARRHPMACCFGGFKQLFGHGQDFTYSLENLGRYYSSYVKIMDHWDKVLPGFVLRVQHEDVINDLPGQVNRILDFCGLEFEQNCVDFHKTARTIKTPSSEQVRQPIYRSGMDQWKNFEQHLNSLTENLIKQ